VSWKLKTQLINTLEIVSSIICIPGVLIILGHLIRDVPSAAIFFWHPFMEATAFMVFIPQGALLLRGNRSLVRAVMEAFDIKERKVLVHSYFAGVGSLIFILGGIFMYYHKEELTRDNPRLAHKLDGPEAEHFLTWHAWLGIATVVFGIFVNSPLGLTMAFNAGMKQFLSPERVEKLKGIHRITAYITYVMGCVCMSLALFSDFISGTHWFFRFFLGSIILILFFTMTVTMFKPQATRERPF